MRTLFFLLVFSLSFGVVLNAQIPVFERTYQLSDHDLCYDVETDGSGYLLLSSVKNTGSSSCDAVLLATDNAGLPLWNKRYTAQPSHAFRQGIGELRLVNSGYTVMGFVNPDAAPSTLSIHLFRTDMSGNPIWGRRYDLPKTYESGDFCPTGDGGYALCTSWIDTTTSFPRYPVLMKTDATGMPQWCFRYDSLFLSGKSYYTAVTESPYGGYLVAGVHSGKLVLFRTDAGGTMTWCREYFSCNGQQKIIALNDGFLIASQNQGAVLLKTDTAGNPLWVKNYPAPGWQFILKDLLHCSDGGFAFSAHMIQGSSVQYSAVYKTDSNGQLLWSGACHAPGTACIGAGIRECYGGGFILAGMAFENTVQKHQNLYLVHTDFAGRTHCSDTIPCDSTLAISTSFTGSVSSRVALLPGVVNLNLQHTAATFANTAYCSSTGTGETAEEKKPRIYPNPAATTVTVSRPGREQEDLLLFSSTGALVMRQLIPKEQAQFTFDISSLPPGLYFLRIGQNGQRLLIAR